MRYGERERELSTKLVSYTAEYFAIDTGSKSLLSGIVSFIPIAAISLLSVLRYPVGRRSSASHCGNSERVRRLKNAALVGTVDSHRSKPQYSGEATLDWDDGLR